MKNKNLAHFMFLFLLNLLFSCKSESDLGKGYFYLSEDEALDVGYPYGSIIYKSNNEYAFSNYIVWGDVQELRVTDRYILVKQRPNMASFVKILISYCQDQKINLTDGILELSFLTRDDVSQIVQFMMKENADCSEIMLSSFLSTLPNISRYFRNNVNYFIVDKDSASVTPPLTHRHFLELTKKNSISEMF